MQTFGITPVPWEQILWYSFGNTEPVSLNVTICRDGNPHVPILTLGSISLFTKQIEHGGNIVLEEALM
jgi:hypothetical protein